MNDVKVEVRDREVWEAKRIKRMRHLTKSTVSLSIITAMALIVSLIVTVQSDSRTEASLSGVLRVARIQQCQALLDTASALVFDFAGPSVRGSNSLEGIWAPDYMFSTDSMSLAFQLNQEALNAEQLGMWGPGGDATKLASDVDTSGGALSEAYPKVKNIRGSRRAAKRMVSRVEQDARSVEQSCRAYK